MQDCFNSTLVQLKANNIGSMRFVFSCFNSTLVQLKVDIRLTEEQREICFNSTLVQLKEVKNRIFHAPGKKFQFYLSSIKSGRVPGKK